MTQQQPAAAVPSNHDRRRSRSHAGRAGRRRAWPPKPARCPSARSWCTKARSSRAGRIACCATSTPRPTRRSSPARGRRGARQLPALRLHALCDAGALRHVRRSHDSRALDRLVFAAADPKAGAAGRCSRCSTIRSSTTRCRWSREFWPRNRPSCCEFLFRKR
jgi:hypothetical protein